MLVTTLLDPRTYTAEKLAELYADRWQVQVNLRHLKQTLHLDVLRCKTVPGIHKVLLMIALAYNLVRLVMLRAPRPSESTCIASASSTRSAICATSRVAIRSVH